jgi:hypothetical protein
VIAFFVGRLTVRPLNADGNPVGFHLHGLAYTTQPASLSACTSSSPCNVDLDLNFDSASAPATTPTPCASGSCFALHNVPDDKLKSKMTVTVDEATPSDTFSGQFYAVGVIQGATNSGRAPGPSPSP